MPQRPCSGCSFTQFKEKFTMRQWSRKDKRSFCKNCTDRMIVAGTPFECTNCGIWKAAEAFDMSQHSANCVNTKVCLACIERRICCECKEAKDEKSFTPGEWTNARKGKERGKCRGCMTRNQEAKKRSRCSLDLPRTFAP